MNRLTTPFITAELQARGQTALRHAARGTHDATETNFASGPLHVDLKLRIVKVHGSEVNLTPTEHEPLMVLVKHAGLVLTDRQLLEGVWEAAYLDELDYLRVYLGQLRHKLEPDPARRNLRMESGIGYKLLVD